MSQTLGVRGVEGVGGDASDADLAAARDRRGLVAVLEVAAAEAFEAGSTAKSTYGALSRNDGRVRHALHEHGLGRVREPDWGLDGGAE